LSRVLQKGARMTWPIFCDRKCVPLCATFRLERSVVGMRCPSIPLLRSTSSQCLPGPYSPVVRMNDQFLFRRLHPESLDCPTEALGLVWRPRVRPAQGLASAGSAAPGLGAESTIVVGPVSSPTYVTSVTLYSGHGTTATVGTATYRVWLSEHDTSDTAPGAGDVELTRGVVTVPVNQAVGRYSVGANFEWRRSVLFVKARVSGSAVALVNWAVSVETGGCAAACEPGPIAAPSAEGALGDSVV